MTPTSFEDENQQNVLDISYCPIDIKECFSNLLDTSLIKMYKKTFVGDFAKLFFKPLRLKTTEINLRDQGLFKKHSFINTTFKCFVNENK